jgi:hypothetical protein
LPTPVLTPVTFVVEILHLTVGQHSEPGQVAVRWSRIGHTDVPKVPIGSTDQIPRGKQNGHGAIVVVANPPGTVDHEAK